MPPQTTTEINLSHPVQYHGYAAAQMRRERQSRLKFYQHPWGVAM